MFKNLYFKSWLLLLCMIVGVGSACAEETSTLTFTDKCGGSGTADNGASWTVASDGTESTYDSSKGIHYGTSSAQVTYIKLSTSDISGTISKVVVNASTASGVSATVSVTVGGSAFGGDAQSLTTSAANYTFEGSASGEIIVTVTKPSKVIKALYVKSIAVTYTSGGGDTPTLEDCDLALTGAPVALYFDLYNNSTAQVINYLTSSTGAVTIDNSDYATFAIDEESKTITVTPIAVTPSAQTITVSQAADDTYKAGTATFTVTITDSTPIPTHTATFSVNGATTTNGFEEGATISFPANPADVSGKSFVGWVTEAIEGTTNEEPVFVTSATMGQADIIYYAVFADVTPGTQVTKTDVLTTSTFGSPSTYTSWTDKSATDGSSAVYAGNSMTYSSDAIQIRATSPSGIVSTTSGGKVTKIVVDWNSGTTSGRTLDVYGWNTAYTGSSQLYSATGKDDVELGSIVYETSTELNVSGDYQYIGLRSHSGAMYLNSISITWVTDTPDAYSDYCTTVVAAAVEKPVITLGANPFLFSTTAAITCATEGATIKFSFDGETWNDYSEALTITATTTIYAKAVKGDDESTVAQVTATKNLAEPTVTVSGDLTLDLDGETSVSAGTLTAAVTYEDAAVEGATVTWSSSDESKATIDEETGAVTILATGSVTFTATYAGNDDYAEATGTKTVTVINSKAPGSESKPYTVAEAIDAIDNNGNVTGVYATGIVSEIVTAYSSQYGNISYNISADGSTNGQQLQAYRGKSYNGENFTSEDDIQVGDVVVVYGNLQKYGSTYEFGQNNQLVSLQRVEKPATPTFSVEEGTYTEDQSVEIACATDGATIYYTIDGNTPTAQSTEYTAAISISETTTIKAIAVKDDVASDVASVTYTINKEPFITLSTTSVAATAEGADGTITVTYNNLTNVLAEVQFVESDGATSAKYDWLVAEINEQTNNIDYIVSGNTSTEARTAYMKVFAIGDEGEAYSGLITITQAGLVVDYATLPFEWNGGTSSKLTANTGVSANGLGSDYAASNAPYCVKFDNTGDYIQVKTDKQPVIAAINVKMIGGASNSTITVQESADGEIFTDVEELTISGEQNDKLYLQTSKVFAAETRYVRFYFTKGSNVGVGAITIDDAYETATIGDAGYATYVAKYNVSFPVEVTAYIVDEIKTSYVNLAKKTAVPAGTPVILKGEAGTYTLTPASSTDAVSGNLLKVSDGTVNGDGSTIYALANKNDAVGFYRVKEGLSVPEGKPYLVIAESGAREFFGFADDGTTTGISTVAAERTADFYNLNGQRVETLKKGGLYIQGGKKVIVK